MSERRRLESWKEIAGHLNRTVRTVQRWEREHGLPVHRLQRHKGATVYAYADEVDAWWTRAETEIVAEPADDADPPRRARPRMAMAAAIVIAALATIGMVRVQLRSWQRTANEASARTIESNHLYARGREAWRLRTPTGFEQARDAFEAGIAVDPRNARAHAGLADTLSLQEAFGLLPAVQALPRARESAERAVQLDPTLGEAHASLAFALWEQGDRERAMSEMERGLSLDPQYATGHHWLALFLQQYSRRDEAIVHARRAIELDPLQPVFWTDLAIVLHGAGRIDEATEVLTEAAARHPRFPEIYVQQAKLARSAGDRRRALDLLRRALALGDNRPIMIAQIGCLERQVGNPGGAREAMQLLRQIESGGGHVPGQAMAIALASTGDNDAVFAVIDQGVAAGEPWVADMAHPDECLAPLRHDPRWPLVTHVIGGPGGR